MAQVKKKACLIIIDGWGISENKEGNFIDVRQSIEMSRSLIISDFVTMH